MYLRIRFCYENYNPDSIVSSWIIPYRGPLGQPVRDFVDDWITHYRHKVYLVGFTIMDPPNTAYPLFPLPDRLKLVR